MITGIWNTANITKKPCKPQLSLIFNIVMQLQNFPCHLGNNKGSRLEIDSKKKKAKLFLSFNPNFICTFLCWLYTDLNRIIVCETVTRYKIGFPTEKKKFCWITLKGDLYLELYCECSYHWNWPAFFYETSFHRATCLELQEFIITS